MRTGPAPPALQTSRRPPHLHTREEKTFTDVMFFCWENVCKIKIKIKEDLWRKHPLHLVKSECHRHCLSNEYAEDCAPHATTVSFASADCCLKLDTSLRLNFNMHIEHSCCNVENSLCMYKSLWWIKHAHQAAMHSPAQACGKHERQDSPPQGMGQHNYCS